jgi:hypothetical protein
MYLLATAGLLGCATAPGTSGVPSDRNLITSEQVTNSRVTTAYGAVEQMRPLWLRSHGQTSINSPASQYATVYVNGQRYGELTTLRSIAAEQVIEIRYYTASESLKRFGAENSGGVIEVRMR